MDRARLRAVLAADLDGVSIPSWDVVDTGDHSGINVDIARYARIGYWESAAAFSGRLVRCVALTRALNIDGCDREDVDIMYYKGQRKHLNSPRFWDVPGLRDELTGWL